MKFSISNGCFYDPAIHEDIPVDAVEVTIKEFKDLSAGRNAGKRIVLGKGGKFQLADTEIVVLSREEVNAQRLNAYANVITGSDRYFAEAQRMELMGEPGWEEVRSEGVRRFESIQQMYPWPDEG